MNACDLTATELRRHYLARDLSPVDVTEAVLRRAEAVQSKLNCFVHIDADNALASAKASEARYAQGQPLSPIDGVPTSIKDVILTKGWVLGRGSALSRGASPSEQDAPSVRKLRAAGAILFGSTSTCEGGWKAVTDSPAFGITRNPYNPALTPGGSSGGASAAVASGAGPLALGSDGGGSVRIPASFTGITGFKPQYGRIPQYPIGPHYGNMSHLGPLTRSVEDAWTMLQVLSGRDALDPDSLPDICLPTLEKSVDLRGLRIAVTCDFGFLPLDEELSRAFDRLPAILEELGAEVMEFTPVPDWRQPYRILWSSGAHQALRRFKDEDLSKVDPGLVHVARYGSQISLNDHLDAQAFRQNLRFEMSRAFLNFDAVISPTASVLPFHAGQEMPDGFAGQDWLDWAGFALGFNLTGQPALSVPFANSSTGLPIGIQIAAAVHNEPIVARVGAAIEAARPEAHWIPERLFIAMNKKRSLMQP